MSEQAHERQKQALQEKLDSAGLPIRDYDFSIEPFKKPAAPSEPLYIWTDSEIPTDEELRSLKYLYETRKQFQLNTATLSTLILRKRPDGLWQFRRGNWPPEKSWSKEAAKLKEIIHGLN